MAQGVGLRYAKRGVGLPAMKGIAQSLLDVRARRCQEQPHLAIGADTVEVLRDRRYIFTLTGTVRVASDGNISSGTSIFAPRALTIA